MLFQRFDQLLLLTSGGRTVYFGEIGEESRTFANYFERNGAQKLPKGANPAEWMLEVIGAAPGSHSDIDWPAVWRDSPEHKAVLNHLAELKTTLSRKPVDQQDKSSYREFAAPFSLQLWECCVRVFQQYFRSPLYIYSKLGLCTIVPIFIGFTFFRAKNSQQGLQNQMFSVFMLFTMSGNLIQQIMPQFVIQRALYEARERPSKAYSWKAFMLANIIVELPWNGLVALIMFFCWYYPIGLYRNAEAAGMLHERGGIMFLFCLMFILFCSTFAHLCIAGIELAETGANIANTLFTFILIFCGVLARPSTMPHFWIFMYRVSPLTYLVSGMLSTGAWGTNLTCDEVELVKFPPPPGMTCGQYLGPYMQALGKNGGDAGYLVDPTSTSLCKMCAQGKSNTYLIQLRMKYPDAWRNFGLLWVYVVFNIAASLFVYWLARVPKGKRAKGVTA